MMKLVFLHILFVLTSTLICHAQKSNTNISGLEASLGQVWFGTGDVSGFSASIGMSKSILKNEKKSHTLLIGGELFSESGSIRPKINDITNQDFIDKTFYQVSNTLLMAKLSYNPFKHFLKEFNITLGPIAGYTSQSYEKEAQRVEEYPGYFVRKSKLDYYKGFIFGYRISTGLNFRIDRKWFLGGRIDFSNYNNGDINTMAGIKLGYSL